MDRTGAEDEVPEDKWVNTDFPEQNPNLINLQNISIGLYIIKLDQQRILFPDTQAKYFYWHNRILNNTGVHADSQWDIYFMPSHQKVIIHNFTVHRDGKIFDKLPTAHFQINKTEREKEGDKYEGFRTLSVIISDLQVGDEIEFSYSIYGADPATKNHFCLSFHTEYYEPIGLLRACVLTPDNKPLFFKTDKYGTKPRIQPAKNLKGYNEYIWQLVPQECAPYESNTPSWYFSRSYVEVCDFDSWKSVVETVLPYFLLEEYPDQLKSTLRAIEKKYESKEERLIACLNFVQKKSGTIV